MEQQTISIAKAGITTMLKARTSVLAAANPPSGRYDDLAALEDNIELQTTILSRFDLIFIVKDNRTRERDEMIAKHVLDIHRKGGQLKTNYGAHLSNPLLSFSQAAYIQGACGRLSVRKMVLMPGSLHMRGLFFTMKMPVLVSYTDTAVAQ
jgi:DNA replicative helicase MCM subunit Mcm2 (Cdc46/Mcm family)